MSVENPSFENEPEPKQEQGQSVEKPKTDWSRVDEIYKKMDDEKRAKMTPEELAEDDRKKEQAKSLLRWAERQRIKKSGTPEQIKEVEEEERVEKENAKKEAGELAAKKEEERRENMTPEERTEEDANRKRVKDTLRHFENLRKVESGTPEEKKQAKKELDAGKEKTQKLVDRMVAESNEQLQKDLETIKQQTYDEIRGRTEEHRRKYGIEVSAAELKREDQELKKRLGMK